jgi:hypothetical protein
MAKWKKSKLRMRKDHQWSARPGYKIFVANAGEVRFDIPEDWVFIPAETALEFHDKQPPDDDCVLQLTVFHLNPQLNWDGLPLAQLLADITGGERHDDMVRGEVHYEKRSDCELAWSEGRWTDPSENRPAVSRSCIARDATTFPLFTMDFWLDDFDRFSPVWDELLRSLRLGDMVKDPRTGKVTRMDARHN